MEIGDAFVRVDHRDGGARGEDGGDVGLEGDFLVGGEFFDFAEEIAEAVVEIDAEGGEGGGVFREEVFAEDADAEAEHDGVGDLHHRGLEVEREERAVLLGLHDLLGVEGAEGLPVHERGVEDFAGLEGRLFLEDDDLCRLSDDLGRCAGGSGSGDELDADGGGGGDGDRLLVGEEIIVAHRADGGFGRGRPGPHRVRVGAGVGLDGVGGTAVGIALAKDGIDGGAEDFRVAGLGVLLGVGRGDLGEIGEGVTLGLEFGDGGLQLWDGGADVGELDDVGLGLEREGAEFGEGVRHALGGREEIGEIGEDAGGDGDVAQFHIDVRVLREGLHDGQERIGGERGGLVGFGVDDGGFHGGHGNKRRRRGAREKEESERQRCGRGTVKGFCRAFLVVAAVKGSARRRADGGRVSGQARHPAW